MLSEQNPSNLLSSPFLYEWTEAKYKYYLKYNGNSWTSYCANWKKWFINLDKFSPISNPTKAEVEGQAQLPKFLFANLIHYSIELIKKKICHTAVALKYQELVRRTTKACVQIVSRASLGLKLQLDK